MHAVAHEFRPQDLVAGHLALDFTNTVTARDTTPLDWLDGYARLVAWAELAGALATPVAARLRAEAERAPREAVAALARARRLREALHDVCVALLARRSVPRAALEEIEAAWKRAAARSGFVARDGRLQLEPEAESSGLDLPVDLVVFAAAALFAHIDTGRTRVCRGRDCGWLFIDSSKAGRRVWCDMATCGNTAKSRRFARAAKRRKSAR